MFRIRLLVVAALATAALVVASAQAAPPKLVGTVGPDSSFKITLTKGGKKVTILKPGRYTFVIKDSAATHNFHLIGPGVNKKTGVGSKVVASWTVTLKTGTYKYICDPHASFMKGSFKVA